MSLFGFFVLSCFFVIFCFFLWIEYIKYQRQLRYFREAKDKSLMTMEEYAKSNQTDMGRVGKEMHQRIKKTQLEEDLNDAYNASNSTEDD